MSSQEMYDLMKPYILGQVQFRKVYDLFTEQISLGLKRKTVRKADTKCFVTYVHDLPTGDEVGRFLALDLGGSNFRILLLFLKGKDPVEISSEVFSLSKETITSTAEKLFDYIADCLYKFMKEHRVENDRLPIGFTFSFPCFQEGLEKATLVRWTKGFTATGVIGENVGRLLKEAIARQPDMQVGRIAILNDTTGTLMSCAHKNPNCRIGLIVGTGINACYLERIENTDKIDPKISAAHSHVIINTECCAFGDNGSINFIRTDFDKQIDAMTPNPGVQLYEKLISGMFLGGLARLNLHKAIEMGLMFEKYPDRNRLLKILEKDPDCFPTQYLSDVESDLSGQHIPERRIIKKLFQIDNASPNDCNNLHYICTVLTMRAAKLAAVGISSLVNRINEPFTVVAIDGSVFRFNRKFGEYIRDQMESMVYPELKYDLMLSEDGSGRGAALVAAVSSARPDLKNLYNKKLFLNQ